MLVLNVFWEILRFLTYKITGFWIQLLFF